VQDNFIYFFFQGEFRLNYLGALRCTSVQSNNKIIMNYYISKKSAHTTEIKGNLSNSIPIDDSLSVRIVIVVCTNQLLFSIINYKLNIKCCSQK